MSIKSVVPSNHLILCCSLLLLPSIFPSIRVFSNEFLGIRWPKYWNFSFSISPSNSGLISLRIDWFDLCAVQGTVKSLLHLYFYLYLCICECEVAQSCLTLCDPMDCSLPGFSVHGIFQARVLEWVAISFSIKVSNSQICIMQVHALINEYTCVCIYIYIYVCVCWKYFADRSASK